MTVGTTVDNLLDRVRRDALLGSRGPVHTLASDPGAGGEMFDFNEDITHIGVGSLLAVGAEIVYVKDVDISAHTVDVIRGYLGSTASAHDVGSVVEVDPRFPKAALVNYAQYEILSWGNELWQTTTKDISVVDTQRTYDLDGVTGEVYFLLDVRLKPVSPTTNWGIDWSGDAWVHADARLLRDMSASEFASTFGLQFLHTPRHDTTARVALAQPLDVSTFDLNTDLVSGVGLETNWIEIVEAGVRQRALGSSSVMARTDWRAGGMSRDAQQATVFDLLRTAQFADLQRNMLFTKAATDLRSRWPYRRTVG